MERKPAFQIMENVRKGKGLSDDMETEMRALGIPDWYIDSCNKIQYLFPKAHATAYVLNALKIAYYKVYYPLAFYASYLTICAMFYLAIPDYKQYCSGPEKLQQLIAEFEGRELEEDEDEGNLLDDLYIIREMYARGLSFAEYDRTVADDIRFTIFDGKIMPPIDIAERDSDFYDGYDSSSTVSDV